MSAFTIAVHGGAGTLERSTMSAEREAGARSGLRAALSAGRAILADGGAALDAVDVAVRILEEDPTFNAGRGAALTRDGFAELDAAIMDGTTERAGAVAGVTCLRNPVHAARLVMERSPHVLLIGRGAEHFAIEQGATTAAPEWFITERACKDLERVLARGGPAPRGTVGAVARDRLGRFAAATSTGGTTGKLAGRVGDCPLIGAGTYADSACAVSATGDGEFFIRAVFAFRVATLLAAGIEVTLALKQGLEHVGRLGGTGGCIAIDRQGRFALEHSTSGMFRGFADDRDERVAIFADER